MRHGQSIIYKKLTYSWSTLKDKTFLTANGYSVIQPFKLNSDNYTIHACIDPKDAVKNEANEAGSFDCNTGSSTNNFLSVNLAASKLRSNFFKNDITANDIVKNSLTYDMNELGLISGETSINRDNFAYKIFSAFQMLGYDTDRGYTSSGNKPHILILNQFQNKYHFSQSEFIDSKTLLKIDELLTEREKKYSQYLDFPLYGHIDHLDENGPAKEFLAYIWSYPFKLLPEAIQLKTEAQFLWCFYTQCGSFVIENFTYNPYDPGDYTVYNEAISPSGNLDSLRSASELLVSLMHEYAHYIDYFVRANPDPELLSGIIDTTTFYDISYEKLMVTEGWYCLKKKTNMDIYDFISRYAATSEGYASNCPEGWSRPLEDFAESFAAYVLAGKDFRNAMSQNEVLAQKYNWLKNNLFKGIEYDTNLTFGNSSGCNDIPELSNYEPGYLRCDEDYVWDNN